MKYLIISLILLTGCSTMPAYNVTAKVAVERATIHTVKEYGPVAIRAAITDGYDNLGRTAAGSALLLSIDVEMQRMYAFSRIGGLMRSLPTLKPDHIITDARKERWILSAL